MLPLEVGALSKLVRCYKATESEKREVSHLRVLRTGAENRHGREELAGRSSKCYVPPCYFLYL